MADDLQAHIAASKANITEMLKRIPEKIRTGSHQDSVKYKALVEACNKALRSSKAKYAVVKQLENELRGLQ